MARELWEREQERRNLDWAIEALYKADQEIERARREQSRRRQGKTSKMTNKVLRLLRENPDLSHDKIAYLAGTSADHVKKICRRHKTTQQ